METGHPESRKLRPLLKRRMLFCQQTHKTHSLVTAEPPFIHTGISHMYQTKPTKHTTVCYHILISSDNRFIYKV